MQYISEQDALAGLKWKYKKMNISGRKRLADILALW